MVGEAGGRPNTSPGWWQKPLPHVPSLGLLAPGQIPLVAGETHQHGWRRLVASLATPTEKPQADPPPLICAFFFPAGAAHLNVFP